MRRAVKRDAVHKEKFYFRKNLIRCRLAIIEVRFVLEDFLSHACYCLYVQCKK